MKSVLVLCTIGLALTTALPALVTINMEYGSMRDSTGAVISSTNTLWALIQDDGDGTLPGGLTSDSSLVSGNTAAAFADFAGQAITVDSLLGGDRIFAVGNFNDPDGYHNELLSDFDLTAASLTSGRIYGFYWFPGLTTGSSTVPTGAFQIGGLNEITSFQGNIGMSIPSDGSNVATGLLSENLNGPGGLTNSRYDAILVPEPSTALLGLLGLALLRRRR
jgi:hypothetical protein